jgi:hypothetical protein
MLRAGRVPKMDGKPVELTQEELVQLRRSGIVPTEQAKPRPFVRKIAFELRDLGVTLNATIKDVPQEEMRTGEHIPNPGPEMVEIEVDDELGKEDSAPREPIAANLGSEGWEMIGLPDVPVETKAD